LFANLPAAPSLDDLLSGEPQDKLIALATLAVRCRSAVERDSYSRDIELIPEPEAPARLALALARLYAGLTMIGAAEAEIWRLLRKVALDCMPSIRKAVFDCLMAKTGPVGLEEVAAAIRYPTNTTRRALEDLVAHNVVRRTRCGSNKDLWELSDLAVTDYQAAGFPEKSEGRRKSPVPEKSGDPRDQSLPEKSEGMLWE
jgi:hypothetical protein